MAKRRFNRRERVLIFGGVFIVVSAAIVPMINRTFKRFEEAELRLAEAQDNLEMARTWQREIVTARGGQDAIYEQLRKRDPKFDLYAFMNQALRELKLENRASVQESSIGATSPLDRVIVSLNGVNMTELVDFLHKIESSGNLIILQQLTHLREARDGKGLECAATFVAPSSGS